MRAHSTVVNVLILAVYMRFVVVVVVVADINGKWKRTTDIV